MAVPPPQLAPAIRLIRRGAYPQAISLLQQAVASQSAHFESRLQLVKACLDWVHIRAGMPLSDVVAEKLDGEAAHYLLLAETQLKALTSRHGASPHVQSMLAVVHIIHGRYAEAERCLKKALAKDFRNPGLLFNQGYALLQLERYNEAVGLFSRLTRQYPQESRYWQELGEALRLGKKPEDSLAAYRHAQALRPDWAQPYGGLACALCDLGRHQEALEELQQGVGRIAGNQDLNFLLAVTALSIAQWGLGWRYYAGRPSAKGQLPYPITYVFPFQSGKTLRVCYDQGLGDELFFLRFVPVLVNKGLSIHYTAHPKLYPLLQGRPEFAGLDKALPDERSECDILVGDLPYLAGMQSTADIPPPFGLQPDAQRVEGLRKELAVFGPPPYLGITWRGGTPKKPGHKGGWRQLFKEISPTRLGELARDWPGTVVVLQRLPKPEDLAGFSAAFGRAYLDWSRLNDDLQDALAGLSLLDEYVGVSNTNMHLLAGIGKMGRVLVPHPAEWRWMAEGEGSPWFPGFKAYRQDRNGEWNEALQALISDLKAQWGKLAAH